MPLVRTILHNGLHLLLVALGLLAAAIVLLVVGVCGYLISLAKGPDAGADRLPWVIVLVVLAGALWSGGLVGKYFDGVKACYRNWWPFRRTFNFAEADKAIEAQEIAKARAESVKSAKYSRRRM